MQGMQLRLWRQAHEITGEVIENLKRRGLDEQAALVAGLIIKWNPRLTTTAGRAVYLAKTVELSWPVFSDEENHHGFRNTVLHEIAHHLAPGGHHRLWRLAFKSIGGDGKRCHNFKVKSRRSRSVQFACTGCGRTIRMGAVRLKRLQQGVVYRCRCRTPVPTAMAAERPRDLIQRKDPES